MSRSYKKHQFSAITNAESEKSFKTASHQKTRSKAKTELNEIQKLSNEDINDVTGNELTNFKTNDIDQWDSPKETKTYHSQSDLKEYSETKPIKGVRASSFVASPSSKTKVFKIRK